MPASVGKEGARWRCTPDQSLGPARVPRPSDLCLGLPRSPPGGRLFWDLLIPVASPGCPSSGKGLYKGQLGASSWLAGAASALWPRSTCPCPGEPRAGVSRPGWKSQKQPWPCPARVRGGVRGEQPFDFFVFEDKSSGIVKEVRPALPVLRDLAGGGRCSWKSRTGLPCKPVPSVPWRPPHQWAGHRKGLGCPVDVASHFSPALQSWDG